MTPITCESLLEKIMALYAVDGARVLVAIAGGPGSGKSTTAEWIVEQLNARQKSTIAAILPQDGFHFDDRVLSERNRLKFKGAPDTFDANGFSALLNRVLLEPEIAVPVFDRTLEISRNCAKIIPKECKLVIVEGSYLLLNSPESWSQLRQHFNLTVALDVPIEELKRRLIKRWLDFGFSQADAEAKALENDIPNATYIIKNSGPADYVVTQN